MIEKIQGYLLSIVSACFIYTIVCAVFGGKNKNSIISFAAGLLLLIVTVQPVINIRLSDFAKAIQKLQITETSYESGIKIDNSEIIADIIKEKCESYILDKATEIGFEPVCIEVQILNDGTYPSPNKVKIIGPYDETQKEILSSCLVTELAVDETSQEWVWEEKSKE